MGGLWQGPLVGVVSSSTEKVLAPLREGLPALRSLGPAEAPPWGLTPRVPGCSGPPAFTDQRWLSAHTRELIGPCVLLSATSALPLQKRGFLFRPRRPLGPTLAFLCLGVSYCSWSVQLSRDQPTTRPSGAPVDTAASHSLPKSPLVKCSSRAPHLVPRTTYASHTNQGGAPSPAGGGPATQNAHVQQVR